VTIFDYDAARSRDLRTTDGFPTGIEWVLVNGVVTIDHEAHRKKAGRALRDPASAP
jgi:hypothetical protein